MKTTVPIIRFCSFATPGYRMRRWFRMKSMALVAPHVELSCWDLARLTAGGGGGIKSQVTWFDPALQGTSYWVWKPWIALQELASMNDGDYLLYCDAGRPPAKLFHHPVDPFIQWLKQQRQDVLPGVNISYYTGGLTRWCKQSVFKALELNPAEFVDVPLIQGSFFFVKKSPTSVAFLQEWFDLCNRFDLVSSATEQERAESPDNFAFHTHDQTLLSILVAKYGLKALLSDKGVIRINGRQAFDWHPPFDDKNPDWFLGELGGVPSNSWRLKVLERIKNGYAFGERGANKLSKLLGFGHIKGFYS